MRHFKSFLELNLSKVQGNYLTLCKMAYGSTVGSTIKSNAYGCGLLRIAESLHEVGCTNFFVNDVTEGIKLRSLLPNVNIFILHGVSLGEELMAINYNLIVVLNNTTQIDIVYNFLQSFRNIKLPYLVALHIDTGMNRLGMTADEVNWFCKRNDCLQHYLHVGYIISHLANSSVQQSKYNIEQHTRFLQLSNYFKGAQLSLANSSGIFLGTEYHFDLVRPGAALYGINPTPKAANPMIPAIRWLSVVLQVANIQKSSYIGYDMLYRTPATSKIATISIGYADGFLRYFRNRVRVFIADIPVNIVGQISMNLVTIDVTSIPDHLVFVGQQVEIIGSNVSLEQFAHQVELSPYELLTNISNQSNKEYIS